MNSQSFRDGASTTSLRLLTIVFMLLGNLWIARLLEPTEAGTYLVAYNLVYIVALVGQLGLRTAVVRWVAESSALNRKAEIRSAIAVTIKLTHLSFFAFTAAVILLLMSVPDQWRSTALSSSHFLWIAVWMFTLGIQYTLPEIFRGQQRFWLAGISSGALQAGLALLGWVVLGAIVEHPQLEQVFQIVALAGVINYGLVMANLLTTLQRLPHGHHRRLGAVLRESLPMLGTQVSTGILSLLDTVIVGAFSGAADAARYGIATRLTALINLPLQICVSVIAPYIAAGFSKQDRQGMQRTAQVGATLAAIPGFAAGITCILFGRQILAAFGPEYVEGYPMLVWLAIGQLTLLSGGPTTVLLMMCGKQDVTLKLVGCIAVISIAAQIICARQYGAVSVAIVVMLTALTLSIVQNLATRRSLGVACNVHFSLPITRLSR